MEMAMSKIEQAVKELFESSVRFKEQKASYERSKRSCIRVISEYFSDKGTDEIRFRFRDSVNTQPVVVKKIQRVNVKFDADELEKVLPRKISRSVISKRYEINDFFGLVNYLKMCGVDPKVFKAFIDVEKTVNAEELERLEEIGEIDRESIEGCFTTEYGNPYYTVKQQKGGDTD